MPPFGPAASAPSNYAAGRERAVEPRAHRRTTRRDGAPSNQGA
ncbi:hypothetical protein [Tsukamurella sp. NPDC003166]